MNILILPNSLNIYNTIVMLESLLENNKTHLEVYAILYEQELALKSELCQLITTKGSNINFIQTDGNNKYLSNEMHAIGFDGCILANPQCFLPENLERILYLSSENLIVGDICELYNEDLDGNDILACGQALEKIDGYYYGFGAQARRGEKFDIGVVLYDLKRMRDELNDRTTHENLKKIDRNKNLSTKVVMNLLFERNVKIIEPERYGFAISLLDEYLRYHNHYDVKDIRIIRIERKDYYRINVNTKPIELVLSKEEEEELYIKGIKRKTFQYRQADALSKRIHELWWTYAKHTSIYDAIYKDMLQKKEQILESVMPDNSDSKERVEKFKQVRKICASIVENDFSGFDKNIEYGQLEAYIDELDNDKAITAMNNLFKRNFDELRVQTEPIKVGFVVYSSSEWQCERIYRLMQRESCFDPWIVVCGYNHGDGDFVRSTYIKTCEFFRKKNNYKIEYMGYCNRWIRERRLDEYQILFYISPFRSLLPYEVNIEYRHVNQVLIHIPYGAYLMNKRDKSYAESFFDLPSFKMTWRYFAENTIIKNIKNEESRLGDYNVVYSGLPKIDDYITKSYIIRKNLWKDKNCKIKIIWAPHFNLQKGMNGTFAENYQWFLNYAKQHQEISWIIKPHPRMMVGLKDARLFKTDNAYKDYLRQWNDLQNARVIEYGEYYDIFDSSTALIHDCGSFLFEYTYTLKPQLVLLPDEPRSTNAVYKKLLECNYSSRGNDFKTIESFIEMLKVGEDYKFAKRTKCFEEELDYYGKNGMMASEFIVNSIKKEIEK